MCSPGSRRSKFGVKEGLKLKFFNGPFPFLRQSEKKIVSLVMSASQIVARKEATPSRKLTTTL